MKKFVHFIYSNLFYEDAIISFRSLKFEMYLPVVFSCLLFHANYNIGSDLEVNYLHTSPACPNKNTRSLRLGSAVLNAGQQNQAYLYYFAIIKLSLNECKIILIFHNSIF